MSESKQRAMSGVPAPTQSDAVANPTQATSVDALPDDQVALLVWREITGPQPMTLVVTRASWEKNKKVIEAAGHTFNPTRIYEFESPVTDKGRKTIFHFQGVVGWMANLI